MTDMHQICMPAPGESWGMSTTFTTPSTNQVKWAAHYACAWNDVQAALTPEQAHAVMKTPPLGSSSFLVRGEMCLCTAMERPARGDFVVVVTDDCYPSYKVHKVVK